MSSEVFSRELVSSTMEELKIGSLASATIGQMLSLSATGAENRVPFIRMDQGIPGLPPCQIGIDGERRRWIVA